VLLATQNPVDLDYKGLGNMGLWAIGRLQTAQDQNRVREGIEAALADSKSTFNFDDMIAGVQKRVFLVHDIHRPAPALMQTRWAMSYLRGPITRDEIRLLGLPAAAAGTTPSGPAPAAATVPAPSAPAPAPVAPSAPSGPPPLPAGMTPRYYNLRGGNVANPFLVAKAAVRYRIGGAISDEATRTLGFPMPAGGQVTELLESAPIEIDESRLADGALAGLSYADLPAYVVTGGAKALERVLKDRLDDRLEVQLLYDAQTKQFAHQGETADAFAARLANLGGANVKRESLQAKINKLESDRSARQQEISGRKMEKWASIGTSILSNIGIFTGRKRTVSGVGTILSKNRMENTAEARVETMDKQIQDLQSELQELQTVDPSRFEQRNVKPAKTDVSLVRYDIAWVY
jgi:hypothetical protein